MLPVLSPIAAPAPTATCETHCPYCALQCGMTLERAGDNVSVLARDFPTNQGKLCPKGWTSAELLNHPERLRSPLIRESKGGDLYPVTWEQALNHIVLRIQDLQKRHGRRFCMSSAPNQFASLLPVLQ